MKLINTVIFCPFIMSTFRALPKRLLNALAKRSLEKQVKLFHLYSLSIAFHKLFIKQVTMMVMREQALKILINLWGELRDKKSSAYVKQGGLAGDCISSESASSSRGRHFRGSWKRRKPWAPKSSHFFPYSEIKATFYAKSYFNPVSGKGRK